MVPTEYKKQPAIVPDAAVTVSIPAAQTARHTRQSATSQPLRMQLFDTKIIHAFNAYQHGPREREDQGRREERLQPREHAGSTLSTRHMLIKWMCA